MTQLLLLAVLSAITVAQVSGYSFGAGQCISKAPSVALLHLQALTILTGDLAKGNFSVTINGQGLSTTGLNYIPSGSTLNVSLFPNTPTPGFFRGFLIRFGPATTGAVNTISYLNPEPTDVTVAVQCAPCLSYQVGGICHFDNLDKTLATGALIIPSPMSGLIMDVNVVVANRNNVSQYYYNYFQMSAVAPGSSMLTTSKPVAPAPTASATTPTSAPASTATTTAAPAGVATTSAPAGTTAAPAGTATTTAPATSVMTTSAPAPTPVVISTSNSTTPTGTASSTVGGKTSSALTSRMVNAALAFMTLAGSVVAFAF